MKRSALLLALVCASPIAAHAINVGAPAPAFVAQDAEGRPLSLASLRGKVVIPDPAGALGHAFDAHTTPDMFVIDRQGRLLYAGAIDDKVSTDPADAKTAHNYVAAALAELGAGRPISPAWTMSYGCSVKYQ